MTNETNYSAPPKLQDNSNDAQKTMQKRLNHIANKAAKRAGERQQRYDGKHDIFAK